MRSEELGVESGVYKSVPGLNARAHGSLELQTHVCHESVSVVSFRLENSSLFSLCIPTIALLTAL